MSYQNKQTDFSADPAVSKVQQSHEFQILTLYEVWKVLLDGVNSHETDEELTEYYNKCMDEIQDRIAKYDATTAASLAVKVCIAKDYEPHVPIAASLKDDMEILIGELPQQ